jgi:hypothetical protein
MTKAKTSAPERGGADWRVVFLEKLAQSSNVSLSARAAKVDVSTVYKARRTEGEFARQWFDALCDGYDAMEMDLLHRLRAGAIENAEAKRKRKFDNASAMRLLAAHRSTVGKIRALREDEDEETTLASINEKLDMMRERMRAANELLTADSEQNGNSASHHGE